MINGAVTHPVLPFVQALEKEKFKVTSAPGENPLTLRYGSFWKEAVADSEFFVPLLISKRMRRWIFEVEAWIAVAPDQYGHHAVTVTSWSNPRDGNNFLFEVIDTVVEKYALAGNLLHCTDYFEGVATAVKRRKRKAK